MTDTDANQKTIRFRLNTSDSDEKRIVDELQRHSNASNFIKRAILNEIDRASLAEQMVTRISDEIKEVLNTALPETVNEEEPISDEFTDKPIINFF